MKTRISKTIFAVIFSTLALLFLSITLYRASLPYNENGVYLDEQSMVTYNESAVISYAVQSLPFSIAAFMLLKSLWKTRNGNESTQAAKFYSISNTKMPWGDYGNILLSGLMEKQNGADAIQRTGPYVPPIVICSFTLVVKDSFKRKIESSGLTGFSFTPIPLVKMVEINWTAWDQNAAEPKFYPESGEPEDYISEGSDNETLRQQTEPLWIMAITNTIHIEAREGAEWWKKEPIIKRSLWKENFAITTKFRSVFIDEHAKEWLTKKCDGKLEFLEVETQ